MDTIKINEQDYPITVNMNVLAAISKHTGMKLADIFKLQDIMDFGDVLFFLWAAVKEGCRIEKKEFTLTVEDIGAGADMGTVAEFMQIFVNSQAPAVDGGAKKKIVRDKTP